MISGGEKKELVLLERYIINKVLILDEPTNELDKDTEKIFKSFV